MAASTRKRGRAVLLWGAGLFLGVQLLASGLLDYCWPQIRFPEMYEQVARFDAVAGNVNVVFLGSSRTGCLIQEPTFNWVARTVTGDSRVTAFNAYVPAGDPILCERTLQRLLEHGAKPRCAIIEVCPEGVNEHTAWLRMHVGWTLCWDDVPAYLRDMVVTENLVRYVGTRFLPLYVYREQIRRQLAERVVAGFRSRSAPPPLATPLMRAAAQPAFHSGESSENASAEGPATTASRHIAPRIDPTRATTVGLEGIQRELLRYRPGGNSAAALERLIKRCRTHGIEPILVSVPLSSAHRRLYNADVESAFQAHVGALARKYACRYIDHRTALPDRFFTDHHHASTEGGSLYSQKIALEVVAPMWK